MDEAVFAALAIVAKNADVSEFRERSFDFFNAIGGVNFFKRILTTEDMQGLGLNFLTLFAGDARCAGEIIVHCSEEILRACQTALISKNENAIKDGIRVLAALQKLTGTAKFLLQVLGTKFELEEQDKVLKESAAGAFAFTRDPFFSSSKDEVEALKMLKVLPAFFPDIASGLATRWQEDPPLVGGGASANFPRMQYATEAGFVVRDVLVGKNLTSQQRRAAIRLGALCVDRFPEILKSIPTLLPALSSVAAIELRVGLARVSSALTHPNAGDTSGDKIDQTWKNDELDTLMSAAQVLDRIAAWISVAGDGEVQDEKVLMACLNSLTQTTNTICQFFKETEFGRQTIVEQDVDDAKRLKTLLLCAVTSVLMLMWMDDPVAGRGLLELAERSGFTRVCGIMIRDVDPSAVRFVCPFLVQISADSWIRAICLGNSTTIELLVQEFNQAVELRSIPRIYYSGMVLVHIMMEHADSIDLIRRLAGLSSLLSYLSTISPTEGREVIERYCAEGVALAMDAFVCQITNRSIAKDRAKLFLEASDKLLKNHFVLDGCNDVGGTDYAELGSRLAWHDLRKVCEVVRLECT